MICARCNQPILPGEGFEEIGKFSPYAGGAVLHVHTKVSCKRPYSQTTQDSIRH